MARGIYDSIDIQRRHFQLQLVLWVEFTSSKVIEFSLAVIRTIYRCCNLFLHSLSVLLSCIDRLNSIDVWSLSLYFFQNSIQGGIFKRIVFNYIVKFFPANFRPRGLVRLSSDRGLPLRTSYMTLPKYHRFKWFNDSMLSHIRSGSKKYGIFFNLSFVMPC